MQRDGALDHSVHTQRLGHIEVISLLGRAHAAPIESAGERGLCYGMRRAVECGASIAV